RPAAPQISSCRTQGQIAVTYSEGPSDATAKIVRHLNNFNAKGNFFVNASWLYTQQYAMVIQNIYNSGHFIGMTYRVRDDDSSLWSHAQIRDDIIKNAQTVESLIGVSPKYVRLHYTPERDVKTEAILADMGYVLVGYNLDSQDYSRKDSVGPNSIDDVYRSAFVRQRDTYDAMGSFISVQYDIPETGALNAVPFMVNAINDEGYDMVRMDGCLNDPQPYKKSATSLETVSDKFSFEQPEYHSGQQPVPEDML
ncbi:glycoside hydrolase/deacetylase, partial [Hesseltinella vesiculosa]